MEAMEDELLLRTGLEMFSTDCSFNSHCAERSRSEIGNYGVVSKACGRQIQAEKDK